MISAEIFNKPRKTQDNRETERYMEKKKRQLKKHNEITPPVCDNETNINNFATEWRKLVKSQQNAGLEFEKVKAISEAHKQEMAHELKMIELTNQSWEMKKSVWFAYLAFSSGLAVFLFGYSGGLSGAMISGSITYLLTKSANHLERLTSR